MALIDKKILTPIRHHQDNANTVIGQASTMKALFDQGAEDLRVKLNGVIDELLATTGAQQIGIDPARGLGNTLADALTNIKNYMNLGASGISAATIGTGSGNTVQSQLEWLLLQIQNVLLNQIPDGTITMQKLSTALANTINGNTSNIGDLTALTTTDKTNLVNALNEIDSSKVEQTIFDGHMTSTVSRAMSLSRDLSLTGVQTTGALPFLPKALIIDVVVAGTKKFCMGKVGANGQHSIYLLPDNGNWYPGSSEGIIMSDSLGNITFGTVTINSNKTLSINWGKTGTGATGTADIKILAIGHGE